MTETITLTAESRVRTGKGGARACRRAGKVPAVIYGGDEEPVLLALSGHDLMMEMKRPGFQSHVYDIALEGRRERVLPREVQRDPLYEHPIHIDFLRVAAGDQLHVDVALAFVNDGAAPGLKKGGVLNIVEHTLEVVCRPDKIPETIAVDLTGLEIGDVIHAQQIALPEGVALASAEAGATIASIAAPTVAPAAADGEGEAAQEPGAIG
jgi:large subunit ribosomal protein L25